MNGGDGGFPFGGAQPAYGLQPFVLLSGHVHLLAKVQICPGPKIYVASDSHKFIIVNECPPSGMLPDFERSVDERSYSIHGRASNVSTVAEAPGDVANVSADLHTLGFTIRVSGTAVCCLRVTYTGYIAIFH